jgi:hypothetical protein
MSYRHRLRAAAVVGVAVLAAAAAPSRAAPQAPVTGTVSVVNDATGKPILGLSPLTDGTVVDRSRLPATPVSLRAGSVRSPLPADPGTYTVTVAGSPEPIHYTVTDDAAAPPIDVLFVGNSLLGSFTAGGEDTPALVRHLATLAGRTITVTEVIHSGYTLQQTWNDGLVTSALGGANRYDFIVLQEYSTLVATNPAAATGTLLHTYAPTFARSLKPGGRVVLFKNWALADPEPFPSRAAARAAIDTGYAAMSAALTARSTPNLLAPIGDEFETIIAARGTSYLIVPDGKHPNDTARYLDAVTLCGILFRESPVHLADLYLPGPVAAELRSVAATAIGY